MTGERRQRPIRGQEEVCSLCGEPYPIEAGHRCGDSPRLSPAGGDWGADW